MAEGARGRPDNLEALGELEKLYEREKEWGKLAAVRAQVAASDDATKKVAICRSSASCSPRRCTTRRRRPAAWQALLALEPRTAARRTR